MAYGIMIVPFFIHPVLIRHRHRHHRQRDGASRFGPSSEWFIWPIPALLSPFAAIFYPLSDPASQWMQVLAHALPPSYVFEGIRSILAGGGAP